MSASLIFALSNLFGKPERSDCTLIFYCSGKSAEEPLSEEEDRAQKAPNDAEQPDAQLEGGHAAVETPKVPCKKAAKDVTEADGLGLPGFETTDIDTATSPSHKREGWPLGSESPKKRKTAETQTDFHPEPLPADSEVIGDPLPAHTFVLTGGSERFRAQIDRWTAEQGYGAKALVRVPLNSPEDLPHALAGIKFMYTGKLDTSDAATLLRVRMQVGYLRIEGCADACDAALLASVTVGEGQRQQSAGGLAGVAQLYGCRDLIAQAQLDPATMRKLLHACRQQLVAHSGSAPQPGQHQGAAAAAAPASAAAAGPSARMKAATGSGPGLGELLAWAFRDAPSLLSDPAMRQQMEGLSAVTLEALLGCDGFITDSEESVLLVLMHWLAVNSGTAADVRQRLLKLVRLCQLSDTYLHRVLPLLTCFGIGPQELRFLQDYAHAAVAKRMRMKQAVEGKYDFKSAWYCTARRPAPHWGPGDRSYEWSMDVAELKEGLISQQQTTVNMLGTYTNGDACVVSNGFEWYPLVQYSKNKDAAGVYLCSELPSSLGIDFQAERGALVKPGPSRMVVYKRCDGERGDRRTEAWTFEYGDDSYMEIGMGWGVATALPLEASPSAAAPGQGSGAAATFAVWATASQLDPVLSRWAPYIKDGKLWGRLSWKARA